MIYQIVDISEYDAFYKYKEEYIGRFIHGTKGDQRGPEDYHQISGNVYWDDCKATRRIFASVKLEEVCDALSN